MKRLGLFFLFVICGFAQEETSIHTSADVLVWCAKESRTNNWAQVLNDCNTPEKLNIRVLDVCFPWDAGFRLGIGYRAPQNSWETNLRYTWFRTEAAKTAQAPDGRISSAFVGNFFIGNSDGANFGPAYHKASIAWNVLMNMFDWELGYNHLLSPALSLRPFIGLKGGWIRQAIFSKWMDPLPTEQIPDASSFGTAKENLENNYWGIGPNIGVNSCWRFLSTKTHELGLFGDISSSLMFGRWSFKDVYTNQVPQKVSVRFSNLDGGSTMIRTFTGLGWNVKTDQSQFGIKLGYETQFWLDQLQFYTFNMGRLADELTLQGATIDLRLDF